MKSKKNLFLGSLILVGSIVGCSSMVESTRKSLLGDSSPRDAKEQKTLWVSKSQYDDLMTKYKDLSEKYENLKDTQLKSRAGFDQLDSIMTDNTETIDIADAAPAPKSVSENKIESDINFYHKAAALVKNEKLDEALKIFQFLEKSQVKQIRVRSKANIGNIYLVKSQYDLALQVFEGIIQNDSFSSYVIPALKKASFCSAKLGLVDKKEKYESLLNDVFEVRG